MPFDAGPGRANPDDVAGELRKRAGESKLFLVALAAAASSPYAHPAPTYINTHHRCTANHRLPRTHSRILSSSSLNPSSLAVTYVAIVSPSSAPLSVCPFCPAPAPTKTTLHGPAHCTSNSFGAIVDFCRLPSVAPSCLSPEQDAWIQSCPGCWVVAALFAPLPCLVWVVDARPRHIHDPPSLLTSSKAPTSSVSGPGNIH